MGYFMGMFEQIMGTFGAAIILPIFIFIVELLLKIKPGQAFKSAIYIGVGLNGLISILNPYFLGAMGEALTEMITTQGIQLPYIDTGWGVLSALSYSTTIGAAIIPVGLVVNFILIRFNLTDTLDIDVWNYWQWAFIGTLIFYQTGNYLMGITVAILMELICIALADFAAPRMQEFFDLPGISFPHGSLISGTLVAMFLRWPLEKLGIFKIKLNSESIQKRFGVFGDSVVVGFIIACVIGLIAYVGQYGTMETWANILTMGIATGSFIYLYPKATGALLEGFNVLNERARDIITAKGGDRELDFGMDGALAIGHPDTITTGLLSMVITVAMIFFLPGNEFLMLGDLGVTPFFLAAGTVAVMNGNLIASVITNIVSLAITFYFSTWISPVFNGIARQIGGIDVEAGSALVGADIRPVSGVAYYLGQNWILIIVSIIAILTLMKYVRNNNKVREILTGHKFSEE
ncbi:PTS galactitol transporter subunit IIC [Tetragenococcus halophilus subsp. flandriensis]|uniref:PTS transporter subunit IIC n=1 Tax=Tetragenococcus halophilus TaxID=51669 RepID=UPI0023EA33A3|nr:PTS transporter subunit IIC [Tetragenococcus halophilus]GMA08455.1 PTS galactitol transporter subunit IIC [Tetragenococcus halophilus subsp. flandriensis]